MDMPCIKWQKHVEEKWSQLDPDQTKWFSSLSEIDQVFELALSQINQEDLNFLSGVSRDYPVQKDPERAARCRENGNASFKTRDYNAAALHYSQGVCLASQRSEQLSLCFANRSAALLHLQHHQECLEDIDRALEHGYPAHLRHKLHERRALCLNHLQHKADPGPQDEEGAGGTEKQRTHLPQCLPGTGPLSSLSPGSSVRFSPGKGRHLVATEGKAAGDVILEDRAYGCVLIPGMERLKGAEGGRERRGVFGTEDRHCHRCLCEAVSPAPCEGCSYARYCSYRCRRAAWEEHHRWECPIGAELRALGVMSQLALRVALKAGLKDVQVAREPIRGKDNGSKPISGRENPVSSTSTSTDRDGGGDPFTCYHGDSYQSVYHLLPHLSSHTPSLRYLYAVTIATLFLKLSRAGPPPASWNSSESRKCTSQSQGQEDKKKPMGWAPELSLLGSVVLRHMFQLRCNAQAVSALINTGDSAVQSTCEVRIATAMFPTLSVLNHSCSPNTSLAFATGPRTGPPSPEPESSAALATAGCGVTVTVRAAREVSQGQEFLHCYGPHSSRMKVSERRRLLQDQYYFLCTCDACSLEEDSEVRGERSGSDTGLQCGKCQEPLKTLTEDGGAWCVCVCGQRVSRVELDLVLKEVKARLEKAVELMEEDRPDEALGVLQRAGPRSGVFLGETHPLQGQLADAKARAYATMGDWRRAASQLESSVVAVGSQYGEDSIEVGRQLFKLAQLHFNGGSPAPALSVIPRARRLLSLHSGEHCPELQELRAMEDCLRDVF
ncbi:SET and MYND domain-containing protein 4 [Osmerus mordax]|uniref:SET and MYND domain-containing protein 4 n=1 Tax=Osmerus mordax TaxID=8014 RepID=UPI00350FEB23